MTKAYRHDQKIIIIEPTFHMLQDGDPTHFAHLRIWAEDCSIDGFFLYAEVDVGGAGYGKSKIQTFPVLTHKDNCVDYHRPNDEEQPGPHITFYLPGGMGADMSLSRENAKEIRTKQDEINKNAGSRMGQARDTFNKAMKKREMDEEEFSRILSKSDLTEKQKNVLVEMIKMKKKHGGCVVTDKLVDSGDSEVEIHETLTRALRKIAKDL